MKVWPFLVIILLVLLVVVPAVAADTFMGFATGKNSNNLAVVDVTGNSVLTTINTGSGPTGVAVNPSGTLLYVVNGFSQTVTVYSVNDYSLKFTIPVSYPTAIAINPSGTRAYISSYTNAKVYVLDLTTNTLIGNGIDVGAGAYGIVYSRYNDRVYVANLGANSVSVINPSTLTVTNTINVGASPAFITALTVKNEVYVTCGGNNSVDIISQDTNTKTGSVALGAVPQSIIQKSTDDFVYIPTDAGVKVVNTYTHVVSSTITSWSGLAIAITPDDTKLYVSNATTTMIHVIDVGTGGITANVNASVSLCQFMVISKVAGESPNPAPMQVTFTVASGALVVTDVYVNVYDGLTGTFISSDETDDAGNSIFWLTPGKRYSVQVNGSDIVSTIQYVQVQPNRDQYTINVETSGWSWNPFNWFNTNGTGINGSADQRKSITSGYRPTTIGTTGYLEVFYNDTTGNTSSVAFQLYRRDATNATYVLVDSGTVAAANASYNFTILNSGNNTYRFYANGTSTLFGVVPRVGEYTFYNYSKVDLGWPSTFYGYFDILCFLLVAYATVKRRSVLLAGAAFELFLSWVFLIIGWANGFGLGFPIMIVVFAIVFFAYAVASWRYGSGF